MKRFFKSLIVFACTYYLASTTINAQLFFALPKKDTVEKRLTPMQELRNDLQSLANSTDFSNAFIGISVISLETGRVLFSKNDTKNFIPASNLKLITTASGLRYLGSDYRFSTRLYLDGKISKSGVLEGDLYIVGRGDPTFSTEFNKNPFGILEQFIHTLDSLGVKSIRGNIIGDDNFFDDKNYGNGWACDDIIYPYSAQIDALSINDNKIDVNISCGDTIGSIANLKLIPDIQYVDLINNVITVNTNDLTDITFNKLPNSDQIEIDGTISYDSTHSNFETISIAIDNPTIYFLKIFLNELKIHNIKHRGALLDIDDIAIKPDYTNYKLLLNHHSEPLADIIKIINQKSHNLAAEMLLKTIGKEILSEGESDKGIELEEKFLSKNGISPDKISIVDGSGLSRQNLISPKYFVTLLSKIYHSALRKPFMNSLAVPGKDGTLERRLTYSLAQSKVKAKTGSMNNVSALTGYVRTRDNEPLSFSIMMVNYTVPISLAQDLQDLICMRLASFSRIPYKERDNEEK